MIKRRRNINLIVIHCSASGPKTTVEDIRKWHKAKGWKDIGYHYVITTDGIIHHGRDINDVGAHVEGHNENSVGVCLVGGHDGKVLHKFSQEQFKSLRVLLEGIRMTYGNIPIRGHYEFANKSCPCFDVQEWLKTSKVIYTA